MKKERRISASLPVPVLLKTITTTLVRLKMNNLNKLKQVKKLQFNRSLVNSNADLHWSHVRTHLCKVDDVAEENCHAVKVFGWNLLFILEFFSHWMRKHLVKESVCSLLLLFQLQHCLGKPKGAVLNRSRHSVH